jgi:D-serine deaminase-like pyridoxal phosphate-dependent protein
MVLPDLPLDEYRVRDAERLMTPALLIYPELVDNNIKATLRMLGNDPNRWRPHVKTAKIASIIRQLIDNGVHNFKCSTTLELETLCEAGAEDVLLAFSVVGANAIRVLQIARSYPGTRVSVLVETPEQALPWEGSKIGIFVDLNSGMNRTGMSADGSAEVVQFARSLGSRFRGLHFYDGHIGGYAPEERRAEAHRGYDRLIHLAKTLQESGIRLEEIVTSGTPSAPFGFSYPGFQGKSFVHRISPGTVVYNDVTSLAQLPDSGFVPAALVLATVISKPLNDQVTCDAGHKSVSADAGVPTCAVLGRNDLEPLKPSEEHLPIRATSPEGVPAIGDKLYLVPRHVCPTVNNFDEAVMVVKGRIASVEAVSARGHESPLAGFETAGGEIG